MSLFCRNSITGTSHHSLQEICSFKTVVCFFIFLSVNQTLLKHDNGIFEALNGNAFFCFGITPSVTKRLNPMSQHNSSSSH